jgi:protein-disulfide isomerase
MTNGDPALTPPNGERRAAAREKARQLREAHRKKERRRRTAVRTTITAVVVVAAAVVALIIVSSIHPPSPGPANMASDGILIGKGLKAERAVASDPDAKPVVNTPDSSGKTVSIVTYVDYLCPFCGKFERTNAGQIGKLVDSGAATVEIHPIPLLASHSNGTKYSLRADNAAACVANYDPNSFWAFNRELFEHQPQENTAGLTDAQIKQLVKDAGVSGYDSVSKCIDDGRYESWAQAALDRTLTGPIPNSSVRQLKGTPLVLVNGKQYQGSLTDPDEFRAFIVKAQADTYSDSKSTGTPTPTPTAGTPTPTK